MFGFLFKTTTYYILWKKFHKQIILIGLSVVAIGFLHIIYEDLFQLLKVAHKESLIWLFMFKWVLIALIVFYNIVKLKNTLLSKHEKEEILEPLHKEVPEQTKHLLDKKKLTSTTDILIRKYKHKHTP